MAKLSDLNKDERNANQGTDRGRAMVKDSIAQDGFGRSGLIDRNGKIIAGNKTHEASGEVFGADSDVIIVESDGTKPIFVKRTDLDLDEEDGAARRLAYRDNFASFFGFELDAGVVAEDLDLGFDFEKLGIFEGDLGIWPDEGPPSLDDLADEYGEPEERDFWPYIKVQVSPETMELFNSLMAMVDSTEDEARKVEIILGHVSL